jgi:hypothetical protein
MIQFVCAPVPFVVGLLVHHLPELETFSDVMEEVYLVDLDNSNIVPPPVDYQLIPEELVLALATSIHEAKFLAQKKLRSTSFVLVQYSCDIKCLRFHRAYQIGNRRCPGFHYRVIQATVGARVC